MVNFEINENLQPVITPEVRAQLDSQGFAVINTDPTHLDQTTSQLGEELGAMQAQRPGWEASDHGVYESFIRVEDLQNEVMQPFGTKDAGAVIIRSGTGEIDVLNGRKAQRVRAVPGTIMLVQGTAKGNETWLTRHLTGTGDTQPVVEIMRSAYDAAEDRMNVSDMHSLGARGRSQLSHAWALEGYKMQRRFNRRIRRLGRQAIR